jgi:hypothetical protein
MTKAMSPGTERATFTTVLHEALAAAEHKCRMANTRLERIRSCSTRARQDADKHAWCLLIPGAEEDLGVALDECDTLLALEARYKQMSCPHELHIFCSKYLANMLRVLLE